MSWHSPVAASMIEFNSSKEKERLRSRHDIVKCVVAELETSTSPQTLLHAMFACRPFLN